jgi:CrcB protein
MTLWLKQILLVGLGGGLGSICRYGVGQLLLRIANFTFPLSTFIVNIVGSLIMGLLFAMWTKETLQMDGRLLWMIGFCGGFTTFSAFTAENFTLIQQGFWGTAILYIVLSVLLSLIGFWFGWMLCK